jgi:hypothetical protein
VRVGLRVLGVWVLGLDAVGTALACSGQAIPTTNPEAPFAPIDD